MHTASPRPPVPARHASQSDAGGSQSPRLQPRPLQAGTHLARCSAIIDLGTHDEPTFNRQQPSTTVNHRQLPRAKRRLLLTFTLFAQDGSTQRLSRQFTHSCDVRSSLSKFLTPWLGTAWSRADARQTTARCPQGEDGNRFVKQPSTTVNNGKPSSTSGLRVSAIAESPCLLVLQASESLNDRTGLPYLNITSASPLIAGLEVPDLKWPAAIFSLKAPNRDTFQHLPAWIQAKIRTSHEWAAMTVQSGRAAAPTAAAATPRNATTATA